MSAPWMFRIASSLGPRYMIPQPCKDLASAEAFMRNHQRLVGDLPGAGTVRIEFHDRDLAEWKPYVSPNEVDAS